MTNTAELHDYPSPEALLSADQALRGRVIDTPLLSVPSLAEITGASSVRVKLEIFQQTGSFKFRGALWRCLQLNHDEREAGVVAYSSGNFAQGLAAAAQSLGIPCTIVMPIDAPETKRTKTERYGAKVVLTEHGDHPREKIASECAVKIAREQKMTLLHPFDDPYIVAGHASLAYEVGRYLMATGESLPDDVLCCVGGGGLIAGLALGFSDMGDSTFVIPVEPIGFDGMGQSLQAGERLTVAGDKATICDALQATAPGIIPFAAMRQCKYEQGISVSDSEVRTAMKVAADLLRIVLEPSGAAPLAALLGASNRFAGRNVLLIASGGNIDPSYFARYLGEAA